MFWLHACEKKRPKISKSEIGEDVKKLRTKGRIEVKTEACATCGKERLASSLENGICVICRPKHGAGNSQQAPNEGSKSPELLEAEKKAKNLPISTTNEIIGRSISCHVGMARGGTVRAKHLGRDITASLKNVVGGEIKSYTELMADAREEAIHRMKLDASMLGADAVVGVNFSTAMIDVGTAEVTAFGTAVNLERK